MSNKIYDAYIKLVEACKDDEVMLDTIDEAMKNFSAYVSAVSKMEFEKKIATESLSGEDLRNSIQELDQKRTSCHEAAIGSCSILNRICKMVEVEPFCPVIEDGNPNGRYVIGDFCAVMTNIFFLKGVENVTSLDELVSLMDKHALESLN